MSSDYFIGSVPATPTSAYSGKDLDTLCNNIRMETIIDSTIISRENSREMLVSSRPQSSNDVKMYEGDGSDVLGTAGDVIVGTNRIVCNFHVAVFTQSTFSFRTART